MIIRKRFWILLWLTVVFSVMTPDLGRRSVWNHNHVFAQSTPLTTALNLTGGSPGCTVLIPSVSAQRAFILNGAVVIPSFGTGLAVQFISSTDNGATGAACATNVTKNNLSGFFIGGQAGSTAIQESIFPLLGQAPIMVTPVGQGISVTVTGGTGAQPVGGFLTTQQY